MSGSRGGRGGHPDYTRPYSNSYSNRWPNQNFYNQEQPNHSNWTEENKWMRTWAPGIWNNNQQTNPTWRQPAYQPTSRERGTYDFEQFQPRFPNAAFNARFSERSLLHLSQTPLNKLTAGAPQRYSNPPSRPPKPEIANKSANEVAEKQKCTGFMPPNDDLRNKVKASLKMFHGAKDAQPSTSQVETATSPQRVREAHRVPEISVTVGTSPGSALRQVRTTPRRRASSQSCTESPSSRLDGIGFIQRTAEVTTIQETEVIANVTVPESEQGLSREQLSRYIKSMDNHQRRQLVEQPRATISRHMLDHLVHENQSAKARHLSSLRFRMNSSELDTRSEPQVELSDELMEQIHELLAQEEVPEKPKPEDDEIQVLEPPPKVAPPCIDLDCDDASSPKKINQLQVLEVPEPIVSIPASVLDNLEISCIESVQIEVLPEEKVVENPVEASSTNKVVEKPVEASSTNKIIEKPVEASSTTKIVEKPVEASSTNSLAFLLADLQQEEQQGKDRIAAIDRSIEELQLERRSLTDKVLSLKQRQFDLLSSALQKPENLDAGESRRIEPTSSSQSTGLISLMQQLETIGIRVAVTDRELATIPPINEKKRKRIEGKNMKRKREKKKLKENSQASSATPLSNPKCTPESRPSPKSKKTPNPATKKDSSKKKSTSDSNRQKRDLARQADQAKKTPLLPTPPAPLPVANKEPEVVVPVVHLTEEKIKYLEPHATAVRCMFGSGPCLFSASEDGTVHVYDLVTGLLSMRILGHLEPVTWLFSVSFNATQDKLKTLTKTADYLECLTLITGSQDGYIRQFALNNGDLLHETPCETAVTCVAGSKRFLYVGTDIGKILVYNPKINSLRKAAFEVSGEVISLKVVDIKSGRALIVAARRMDPVVFDLENEQQLYTLTSNVPSSSFYSISVHASLVYCCDANKNVFSCNLDGKEWPLRKLETLPSAAVSSYHDSVRYLILGCLDGVVRILDPQRKPRVIDIPGEQMKTLTCMKVIGSKIVCGGLGGEISMRSIPKTPV